MIPGKETGAHELAPEVIAAYLRHHPDFLTEHPELMSALTPPALRRGEGVLDMQQFMLQRLREELARARSAHRALIATSRSNLSSQGRVHAAVLAIIAASSFEQLIQVVTTDLAVLLDVDVVTIGVESAASAQPRLPLHGIQMLRRGTVDDLLGAERAALLRADTAGEAALFGGAAGLVRSQALLRLAVSEQAPVGLLCIGTRKPEKFHPGQGTELLCFLARSLELTIAAWLNLTA
ncbi:MAG: DUF484 family protein [Alphaproteobacteria bacterium]|nr:DUF484 family protein [Alphaproteobacteria bacterium]